MAIKNDPINEALRRGHTIDITTRGRRSGQDRRIEIVFHNIGGRLYISGQPSRRRRSWLANLDANPGFTFHQGRQGHQLLAAQARGRAAEPEGLQLRHGLR